MTWAKKRSPIKSEITTSVASRIGAATGKSRKGRDKVTRVTSPIKGAPTNAKQWNRWTP